MSHPKPTIGRIVLYRLTQGDADRINRRRTDSESIRKRINDSAWPLGAQAHIGNQAQPGEECPAVVTRVWDQDNVNLQVLLDGNDTYWATTVPSVSGEVESAPGCWRWPPRA